jgi:hypothetical protein
MINFGGASGPQCRIATNPRNSSRHLIKVERLTDYPGDQIELT